MKDRRAPQAGRAGLDDLRLSSRRGSEARTHVRLPLATDRAMSPT